jgi:hypothetical protein
LSEVYQGRDEPFSQYVIRVSNLYSRLEEVVDVQEQIRFAIERCHPSFKKFLFGEKFTSLQHLADRGLAIQQHLLSDLYYHGSQAKKEKVENPLAILQQSAEASNSNWLLPRALNSGLVSRSADNNKVSDGVRKGKGGKNKVVCYRCGRVGHYATQCTSTSNRNRESNAVNGRKNRKIIRRNESEDFSPLIDVNIRGLKRQCFADSGSSVNLLQEGLAKVLMKRGVKFIQRDVELCLARGTAVATGSMRVNIFVHGKRVPTLFYVLPGLQHEVLIGREFLADAGLCLNLADKSWNFVNSKESFPFAKPFVRRGTWKGNSKSDDLVNQLVSLREVRNSEPVNGKAKCNFPSIFREPLKKMECGTVSNKVQKATQEPKVSVDMEPLVDVKLRGLTRQCYLDSDSCANLLNAGLARVLTKRGAKFRQHNVDLYVANSKATAIGTMMITVNIRGRRVPTLFYVLPGVKHQIVVGCEFLSDANIRLNMATNSWKFRDLEGTYPFVFPFYTRGLIWKNVQPRNVVHVPVSRNEVIPRSESPKFRGKENGTGKQQNVNRRQFGGSVENSGSGTRRQTLSERNVTKNC